MRSANWAAASKPTPDLAPVTNAVRLVLVVIWVLLLEGSGFLV